MDAMTQMVRTLTVDPPTLAERRRERNRRYQEGDRDLWRWYRKHVQPLSEMIRMFGGARANS